ncbi:beta-phosphoglucomutase [Heyndrickxia acidiproducens]|uniref:beta-phosphoglucomutase n=1 Tax=Heyndrickxia acidiproducens TaxID=1121084 RepID=UPI00037F7A57|nr:beta-phosphoglucomutase [Heyndrickxia acidiproducens]
MAASQIQAFIFDLDGVITDTAEYHYLAWKKLAEELNIPFDRAFNETLKGVSRMDSLMKILNHVEPAPAFSAEELAHLAARKNRYYVELIQQITPQDLLPGIEVLLKDIKDRGIRIGLASASKNAMFVINKLGIACYFDEIVDAAQIKNGKPDPEIFLTAAKQLGSDPAVCVGIEDAEAGIRAIKSAGMFAVGVGTPDQMQEADYRVNGTAELAYPQIESAFFLKRKG